VSAVLVFSHLKKQPVGRLEKTVFTRSFEATHSKRRKKGMAANPSPSPSLY